MTLLHNTLVAIANGWYTLVDVTSLPVLLAVGALATALAWLSIVEVEDMNQMGHKPDVVQH